MIQGHCGQSHVIAVSLTCQTPGLADLFFHQQWRALAEHDINTHDAITGGRKSQSTNWWLQFYRDLKGVELCIIVLTFVVGGPRWPKNYRHCIDPRFYVKIAEMQDWRCFGLHLGTVAAYLEHLGH